MEEKKKIKRINLLQLSIRKTLDNDDYASLTWGVRNNYPRIQVFTSKDFKKEDGTADYDKLIIAPFTYPIIFTLISNLEVLAKNSELKTPPISKIECFNTKFVDNKRTDEIEKQAEVKITRNNDNVICIGVKNDKHEIYFPLLPDTKWHKFYTKNGEEITNQVVLSNIQTLSYVNLLKNTFADTLLIKPE